MQPIPMDLMGEQVGECPPGIGTPAKNSYLLYENALRSAVNHSALDEISSQHQIMQTDRNNAHTLPSSMS